MTNILVPLLPVDVNATPNQAERVSKSAVKEANNLQGGTDTAQTEQCSGADREKSTVPVEQQLAR